MPSIVSQKHTIIHVLCSSRKYQYSTTEEIGNSWGWFFFQRPKNLKNYTLMILNKGVKSRLRGIKHKTIWIILLFVISAALFKTSLLEFPDELGVLTKNPCCGGRCTAQRLRCPILLEKTCFKSLVFTKWTDDSSGASMP